MRVIAGLGNPGQRYVWTRHNVGFMIVQRVADRLNATLEPRGQSLQAEVRGVDGQSVRLVLPQSYMNRSGEVLEEFAADAGDHGMVVVYDDVDLPVGSVRIRKAGGAGGHRGVASVIDRCGPDFVRIRVGVGRPADNEDTAEYVLAPLSDNDREQLAGGIDGAVDAVGCVLADGVDVAMNRFNGAPASAES